MSRGGRPRRHHGPTRPKRRGFLGGTLRLNARGTGTVETAEGVFTVLPQHVGEAINGDAVQLRPLPANYGSASAHRRPDTRLATIAAVVERGVTTFVARYEEAGNLRVLCPLDERLGHDFVVAVSDDAPQRLGVVPDDVVVARITAYPTRRDVGVATVERRIGVEDDESVAIESVIASHDLATQFSPAALEQARSLSLDVEEALAAQPARRDIRSRFLVTVDPPDARDFDDAVSLCELPEGGWLLGVHIADVSHYVPLGSPLDLAARERATSVYLADRVLPMLPEELSCELCSLRPGEDRLAMTVDLTLDAHARVQATDIYPSVIRSRARLTYGEVDALLAAPAGEPLPVVDHMELRPFFGALHRVADLRGDLRRARGSVDFASVEARVVLDASGAPTGVTVRRRTPATALVEEAMLAANEAVARRLLRAKAPAPFRVHEPPAADALAGLLDVLDAVAPEALDPETRAGVGLGESHALQRVLARVAGTQQELVVNATMLRSMRKATYEPKNEGHFGLGAEAYLHFTSPIRRYPDLMVHRTLTALLTGELKGDYRQELREYLALACRQSSKMERVAAEAAADSQSVKMAEYMSRFIGEDFWGQVVSVAPYGMFVRLDETCAEGLLHVRELGEGWVDFDESARELREPETGRAWRLGQHICVRVRSCDAFRGHIDFALPRKAVQDDAPAVIR